MHGYGLESQPEVRSSTPPPPTLLPHREKLFVRHVVCAGGEGSGGVVLGSGVGYWPLGWETAHFSGRGGLRARLARDVKCEVCPL